MSEETGKVDPASLVDAWLKHFESLSRKAALCERMVGWVRSHGVEASEDCDRSGKPHCDCLEKLLSEFDREAKK